MSVASSVLYSYLFLYKYSPVFVQNMLVSLYGYTEYRKRHSKVFQEKLAFLRESQWYSESEIENYKNEQISKLTDYVYKEVPYYRELFKKNKLHPNDLKTIQDLPKLPILTKEDVRANYKQMLAPNYSGKYSQSHTGGSTGKALDFYISSECFQFQWAVWWRFRERFGIQFNEKHLNFTGKPVVPIHQKNPPFWRINKPLNQYYSNMQQIKKENIRHFVDMINKENFSFFTGYPSILYSLADFIEGEGLKIENGPKVIMTGAEKLFDFQKEKFEKVFNCEAVDQYGFSEAAGNASKCEKGVFHEDFEFGALELLDEDVSSAEKSIIATGFTNYAMPLIRYQVGDTAVKIETPCECGRKSTAYKEIVGRSEDYIITPEGTKVLRFGYLFKDMKNIRECQIRQERPGEIEFLVVARENYNSADEKKLLSRVSDWISPTMKAKVKQVNEIPRTKSGKFRAVVSKVKDF